LAIVAVACIVTVVLLFLVAGAEAAPAAWAGEGTPGTTSSIPEGVDLDVTFINRMPMYNPYCVEFLYDAPGQPGRPILCPGTENEQRWPEQGEAVTFTAHIVNKGTLPSPAFGYAWHIDTVEVASGTLAALDAGAEVTATLSWPWPHDLSPDGQQALGEHTVRFTADPTNAIAEPFEGNNSLEDHTRAMSFSIYITPEMYDAYNVPVALKWPWSAEDWLQKQIAAMNAAFANSIYAVTPQGATVRVRINTIGVVSTDPGPDGAHDGGWYLRDEVRCEGCGYYDPTTDIDWGLVHELSHQVSLIDLYAIGAVASDVTVLNREGLPANVGFAWHNGGIMMGGDTTPHNNPHLYSSHSAGGATTLAGYRNGFYGSYLYDIPLRNYLRILDNQGNPAAGVAVSLYQRAVSGGGRREFVVGSTPEISGTTDASGILALPNRPANGGTVTANGHVLDDNPFGVVDVIGNQDLFLIRLSRENHEEFHWLDITQFNLAYWQGDTLSHTFTISSHVPPSGAPAPPMLAGSQVEGTWASLDWQPSPSRDVVGYRVYRAAAPQYRYLAASGLLPGTHFEESLAGQGDGEHRLYAVTAVSGDGRESGFGEFVYAPGLGSPTNVVVAPDGLRSVLNNGNLYPLLLQQSDGRYSHRLVNVEYDLDGAQFLAYDSAGRLWLSGFGQFAGSRRAVRAYDGEMRPAVAFGEEGSAPGQFVTPAGIAPWGSPCTYGGPYTPDEHTLLLLHFDGDYAGVQGEVGTADGAGFTAARHGQGVHLDGSDTLTYTTAGNLNRVAGTVEFWVRMDQQDDVGQIHVLFESDGQGGGIQIVKHGGASLNFLMRTPTNLVDLVAAAGDWRAGEWHHVAATWQEKRMALIVDGLTLASSETASPPTSLDDILYVGSSPRGDWQADAVIDELRISDVPRLGNSDSCGGILVVDSGNHRLQAFDMLGTLLSTYGSLGSGAGQFSSPQGLAVDGNGQVLVADQGNNRLVVLGFDGTEFGYLDSFSADLRGPTGVAVGPAGQIVVADTGNNRVVVLDPQGSFLAAYTEPNDGYTGPFYAPRGVAVEPDGDLVVADTGNRRVVTVRGALAEHWRIWLPLVARSW